MAVDSNSKQRIPELFQEIMRVDDELLSLIGPDLFRAGEKRNRWIELKKRKIELRKAAEIALQWNHNKGNNKDG